MSKPGTGDSIPTGLDDHRHSLLLTASWSSSDIFPANIKTLSALDSVSTRTVLVANVRAQASRMDAHSDDVPVQSPLASASSVSQKPPRRYAFACSNCRRKKIKCDGEKPICGNCTGNLQETCRYRHQRSAEVELRRAQDQILALQQQLNGAAPHGRANVVPAIHSTRTLESSAHLGAGDSESSNHENRSEEDLELFWSQVSLDDEGSVRNSFFVSENLLTYMGTAKLSWFDIPFPFGYRQNQFEKACWQAERNLRSF